jgi:hypothetical protein
MERRRLLQISNGARAQQICLQVCGAFLPLAFFDICSKVDKILRRHLPKAAHVSSASVVCSPFIYKFLCDKDFPLVKGYAGVGVVVSGALVHQCVRRFSANDAIEKLRCRNDDRVAMLSPANDGSVDIWQGLP